MTHPPIPPDCPYFEGNLFLVPGCGFNDATAIDMRYEPSLEWRPIIAAVMEMAWLKVSRSEYSEAHIRETIEANNNALAWREWGEQEASSS